MKRIIGIILALVLLLCGTLPTFAVASADKVSFELEGLGIIDPANNDKEYVSRSEFSKMIVALLGMQEVAELTPATDRFADVSPSADYAKAVSLLSRLGVINGVSENSFAPDAAILTEQAVKILVVCTGYRDIAERDGGWPNGYMVTAGKIGLLNNVDVSVPISRAALYRLLHNALDAKLLSAILGDDEGRMEIGGTLREALMSGNNTERYQQTGVVQANAYTYIGSPISDMREDEVAIGNVLYRVGETNAAELVGHNVEFFAVETADDAFEIISIRPAKNEETITLKPDEFLSKSGTTLKYLDENEKERSVTVPTSAKVIYNGTRVLRPADSIYDIKNGSMSLIAHAGGKTIDVVIIEEFKSVVATSFKENNFTFRPDTPFEGRTSFFVDPDDEAYKLITVDVDGQPIETFTDTRVVSIMKSQDGSRVKVMVSDKTIEGVLEAIHEDGITVDGTDYAIDNSCSLSLSVGKSYEMFLNYRDEVVMAVGEVNENYAYILGAARTGGLGGGQVRMLLAGTVDFGVEVNEEDVTDTDQIPFLVGQNSGVAVYDLANRVRIGNTNYSATEAVTILNNPEMAVVSYTLNDDGTIRSIVPADYYGGHTGTERSKYSVYEMVFGGSEFYQGFALSAQTKVICVPVSMTNNVVAIRNNASEEDCMVKVTVDVGNNEVGYLACGYDIDEKGEKVRLLVMRAVMEADTVRPTTLTSSRASIVTDVVTRYKEEVGDNVTTYKIQNGGSVLELDALEAGFGSTGKLGNVTAGSLISYLVNKDDKLESALVIRDLDALSSDREVTNNTIGITEVYGTATGILANQVDSVNYRLVTNLTVSVNGREQTIGVPQLNKPPVYIFNTKKCTAEAASIGDVIPNRDKVYVVYRTGDKLIRAIVIMR